MKFFSPSKPEVAFPDGGAGARVLDAAGLGAERETRQRGPGARAGARRRGWARARDQMIVL